MPLEKLTGSVLVTPGVSSVDYNHVVSAHRRSNYHTKRYALIGVTRASEAKITRGVNLHFAGATLIEGNTLGGSVNRSTASVSVRTSSLTT